MNITVWVSFLLKIFFVIQFISNGKTGLDDSDLNVNLDKNCLFQSNAVGI